MNSVSVRQLMSWASVGGFGFSLCKRTLLSTSKKRFFLESFEVDRVVFPNSIVMLKNTNVHNALTVITHVLGLIR